MATLILFSVLFWAAAGLLAFVAMIGPCGFAPDERCELAGGGWLWFLADVSPWTVILVSAVIYSAAVLLIGRARKVL